MFNCIFFFKTCPARKKMILKKVCIKICLNDLGTFLNTKHNVHRFTFNLHRFEDDDSRKRTLKYYLLRYCSF